MALGGAGHAGPSLNDTIYLNPSYTSFIPAYSLALNYQWYWGGNIGTDGASERQGRVMNVAVQDGKSELFQAGMGYTARPDGTFINIGASKALMERFGIGLGAKFFMPNSNTNVRYGDFTFSSTFIALDWLQTVLVVDNLFAGPELNARGLYREVVLGTKFNVMGTMLMYFDPHYTPDLSGEKYGYEGGVEFVVFQDAYLRMGSFRNSSVPFKNGIRANGYGFGVGWIGPKLTLDYGISRTLEPVSDVAHSMGATIYF